VSKFLLDANLSPKTAVFLSESFGLDAVHQRDVLPDSPKDEEIIALAKREGRIIITFDKGFGERYYHLERGQLGIIILRLRNQRRLAVEQTLTRFFQEQASGIALDTSLVTIEGATVRVTIPA
jgi:predicted nuclease of predicted toxin-antitoxin system